MSARTTEEVVDNHLKAFAGGDLDSIMNDFANDAVFYKPDGILRGKDELTQLFKGLLNEMPAGSHIQIKQQFIDDELTYLHWSSESERVEIPFATDTLLVRDGEITKQAFEAQIQNKP